MGHNLNCLFISFFFFFSSSFDFCPVDSESRDQDPVENLGQVYTALSCIDYKRKF